MEQVHFWITMTLFSESLCDVPNLWYKIVCPLICKLQIHHIVELHFWKFCITQEHSKFSGNPTNISNTKLCVVRKTKWFWKPIAPIKMFGLQNVCVVYHFTWCIKYRWSFVLATFCASEFRRYQALFAACFISCSEMNKKLKQTNNPI